MRQVGVEEEMLLIDPVSRRTTAASDRVVHASREAEAELEQELFLQQIETTSAPHTDMVELQRDLATQRRVAAESAEQLGTVLAAVATPILSEGDGQTTPGARYASMVSTFGLVGRRSLVCATHVHVEVVDAEAVPVIDAIRPWLPLLAAVSTNSPYDRGVDTGYASWRQQVCDSWPSAGPVEPFGDDAGYRAAVNALIASGAAMDEAMLFFDARIARSFPTVEIRVADVCTDLDDTILVAEIARGLVETAARDLSDGNRHDPWRVDLLRAARWRARHDGLAGALVSPTTRSLVPAEQALETLLDHLRPALEDHGTASLVQDGFARLLADGTGAERQRTVAEAGDLTLVVDDVIRRTRAAFGG